MSSINLLDAMQEPVSDLATMSHEKCYVNKSIRMFVRNLQKAIGGLPKTSKYEAGPKLMNAIESLQDACTDAYTADTPQERLQYINEAIRKTRFLGNRLRGAYDSHFFPEAFFVYHFALCESIINQLKIWRNTTESSNQVSQPRAEVGASLSSIFGVV